MTDIVSIASAIFLLVGSVFTLIGSIGIVRMPDVFTRLHAAGSTDTLGAAGVLLGLALKAGFSLLLVKLLLMHSLTTTQSTLALLILMLL